MSLIYMDGEDSLADHIRSRPTKRMVEFFGTKEIQDSYNLSSVISWRMDFYPGLDDCYCDEYDLLKKRLAHGSRLPCGEISKRTDVLCIYKNRGRLVYNIHKAGQCPHYLKLIK